LDNATAYNVNGRGDSYKGEQTVRQSKDYYFIMKWFWDHGIQISGYKQTAGILFLAIVDSLNRNFWNPVHLSLEIILNKVRVDKKTYLRDRKWLIDNGFLLIEAGKNNFSLSMFSLGSAV
jgi:hypothetical protein